MTSRPGRAPVDHHLRARWRRRPAHRLVGAVRRQPGDGGRERGAATNAFDGNLSTIWHTKYTGGSDPAPHEIQINMGASYSVSGLRYLPRQDGGSGAANGRIGQYEVYVSTDGTNWGTVVVTGAFANDASQKDVRFTAETGQYLRLRAVSEVAGNPWTSAAEIYALN
ncbi:discoidin domain-containing protein [Micromonospora sp. NPDC005313]|uniref:discoidin domain-containing protein n=1 Tax=unclassified Micromonospora TaxID=2617518 RepID=UPI0033B49311